MPYLSKIRLNGVTYDLKVAGDAMVTGVKGDAESEYRVGDVNITPENVGTISTEDTQSLTDTQKSTARDNLGLGSAATRSVPASGNANATQVVLGSDTRLTGSYKTDDSASTTINDTDYVPMSDSSGTKKKTLWSTIIAKVKAALATVATSGSYNDLSDKPTINFSGVTFYSGNYANAEHNANNMVKNGAYYYNSNGPSTSIGASSVDGAMYVQQSDDTWVAQIAQDYRNGNLFVRSKNNGTWTSWKKPESGVTDNLKTPRSSSGDYNDDLPGKNKTKIVEHGTSSANRPADQWFFVVTMQGGDTAYATQIAYGMTTTNNYIRVYNGGAWGAWKAFRNPTGNATAAQVLSGYTASNASSDGFSGNIPIKSGSSQVNNAYDNGTNIYFVFPYGYYPSESHWGVSNSSEIYIPYSNLASGIGLNAGKIVKGESCLGITGTGIHSHTDTWTPNSSQYNSSQAEIGITHNARYVNTAVCYSAGRTSVTNGDSYLYVTNGPTTVLSDYAKMGNAKGFYLKPDGTFQGSPTIEFLEWGTWTVIDSYYIQNLSKYNGYYFKSYSSNRIGLVRIQFTVAAGQSIYYHYTY